MVMCAECICVCVLVSRSRRARGRTSKVIVLPLNRHRTGVSQSPALGTRNVPRSSSLERRPQNPGPRHSGRIPSLMLAARLSSNVALRTRAVLVSRRTIVVGRDHGNFNWVFLMVPQVPPPPTSARHARCASCAHRSQCMHRAYLQPAPTRHHAPQAEEWSIERFGKFHRM